MMPVQACLRGRYNSAAQFFVCVADVAVRESVARISVQCHAMPRALDVAASPTPRTRLDGSTSGIFLYVETHDRAKGSWLFPHFNSAFTCGSDHCNLRHHSDPVCWVASNRPSFRFRFALVPRHGKLRLYSKTKHEVGVLQQDLSSPDLGHSRRRFVITG